MDVGEGMNEGALEITVHYDALGVVEHRDYKWVGGDVARFSERLLLDADPSAVRYDKFPSEPGDKFEFGPFRLRVLEAERGFFHNTVLAVRDRGVVTDLRCLWHRVGRLAQIAYTRFIITLAVWRLAERNEGAIPTWRDIHLLQKVERWTKRKSDV